MISHFPIHITDMDFAEDRVTKTWKLIFKNIRKHSSPSTNLNCHWPTYTRPSHQDICVTDTVLADKLTRRLQNHYPFLENCAASQLSDVFILNTCLIKISRVTVFFENEYSPIINLTEHCIKQYYT